MTTKDKVEERIRELVPKLKELKFGCEVILDGKLHNPTGRPLSYNQSVRLVNEEVMTKKEFEEQARKKIKEVIGSPIHLEHLLMAIEKVGVFYRIFPTEKNMVRIGTFMNEKEMEEKKAEGTCEIGEDYDLSKTFFNQSKELYLFLLNILTNH
jgi:hypothetical protein